MSKTTDAARILQARINMAQTDMHVAIGAWVRGGFLHDIDRHRLGMIRAHCDQLLSGNRPSSNIEAAADAYDEAYSHG